MKKTISLLLVLLLAADPAVAQLKPLVIQSGITKQLPANTTLQLDASSTGAAPVNVGQGTAPTSPVNGDIWVTSAGVFVRSGGVTIGPLNTGTGTLSPSGSPAAGNMAKFSSGTALTNGDLSGDCTTGGTLAVNCTKTGGTAFGAAATLGVGAGLTSSGGNIVNNAAAVTGAVKSNGSGTMSQAGCSDLSGAAASCGTDATNAANIGSGNLPAARMTANLSSAIDTAFGSTRGAVLERGASGWTIIAPASTSGWVLTSNGVGADPTYQAAGGSTAGYVKAASTASLMTSFGGL